MAEQTAIHNTSLSIEKHSIDHILENQRHRNPGNQFTIRFAPVAYLAAVRSAFSFSHPLDLSLNDALASSS